MTRWLLNFAVQTIALISLSSIDGLAQSQDRVQIEKEIQVLREQLRQKAEQLRQKELEFLAPSPEDRAQFAEFLLQPDTGLARLLPREKFREEPTLREGGAYYSFTRLSNSYDRDPQISLERDTLSTGFAGADFGFLALLGDIPIESTGLDHKCAQYLATFVAPSLEPEAREQQRKSGAGFTVAGYLYKASLPTMVGKTYILRSISYRRFDVLVAFRIVREDIDGSLVLAWKKLKEFPTPILERH